MSRSLYWLQCGGCGGDSMSWLSAESPDFIGLLEMLEIEVLWHPSLSNAGAMEHRNSDLGFFLRFCRERGLDKVGRGHGNFLSCGSLDMPMGTRAARFVRSARPLGRGADRNRNQRPEQSRGVGYETDHLHWKSF